MFCSFLVCSWNWLPKSHYFALFYESWQTMTCMRMTPWMPLKSSTSAIKVQWSMVDVYVFCRSRPKTLLCTEIWRFTSYLENRNWYIIPWLSVNPTAPHYSANSYTILFTYPSSTVRLSIHHHHYMTLAFSTDFLLCVVWSLHLIYFPYQHISCLFIRPSPLPLRI